MYQSPREWSKKIYRYIGIKGKIIYDGPEIKKGPVHSMQVDFYLLNNPNASAHDHFVCRLIEKIYLQKHRIYLYCKDKAEAQHFDDLLWTFNDTSFVPHGLSQQDISQSFSVILSNEAPSTICDVLINLSTSVPLFYQQFKRIVEIVSPKETERALSREHYQFYQSQNIIIKTHKL